MRNQATGEDILELGIFQNLPQAIVDGAGMGATHVARTVDILGAVLLSELDERLNTEFAKPWHKYITDPINSAQDSYRLDPTVTGKASAVVGEAVEMLVPLFLRSPTAFSTSAWAAESDRLIEAGVNIKGASWGSAIHATGISVGFYLPFLGKTAMRTILGWGAAGNAGLGAATTGLEKAALHYTGNEKEAENFNPIAREALAMDTLAGIIFSGVARHSYITVSKKRANAIAAETKGAVYQGGNRSEMLAEAYKPSSVDAFLTVNSARNLHTNNPLGVASDSGTFVKNQKATKKALAQTLEGKPVNVADDLGGAVFQPDPKQPGIRSQKEAIEAKRFMADATNPKKESELFKQFEALEESEKGKIIGSDLFRELSEAYRQNRTIMTAAVQSASRRLARAYFTYRLKKGLPKGSTILFTSGGTGSGKSTSIENIGSVFSIRKKAHTVFDSTLSDRNAAIALINQALEAGTKVEIVHVQRNPLKAMEGVLHRAKKEGRVVPIGAHVKSHIDAVETILNLEKHYKNNPNVNIKVIDNTRGEGMERLSNVAFLKKLKYNISYERYVETAIDFYRRGEISRDVLERTIDRPAFRKEIERVIRKREAIQGRSENDGGDTGGAPLHSDSPESTLFNESEELQKGLSERNQRGDRLPSGRGEQDRLASGQHRTRQKNPRNKVASEAIELLDDSTAASQKNLSLILGAARGVLRENPDITITLDDGTEVPAGAALESADAEVENAIIAAKTYRSLLMSHTGQ